jgi:hypothetical protein
MRPVISPDIRLIAKHGCQHSKYGHVAEVDGLTSFIDPTAGLFICL